MRDVYLDYAAATPVDPEVAAAMLPYFTERFWNPSAPYAHAREVRARKHPEHLLAHHVGRLADAVHEDIDLLDGGRFHRIETVWAEHLGRDVLHLLPGAHLAPDEIFGSLCLLSLHGGSLLCAPSSGTVGGHRRSATLYGQHGGVANANDRQISSSPLRRAHLLAERPSSSSAPLASPPRRASLLKSPSQPLASPIANVPPRYPLPVPSPMSLSPKLGFFTFLGPIS